MSAVSTVKRARIEGIDVARALAGLIMIQGHGYDGWASPAAKETLGYAFTRVLGSLPLPAFLLLAGASVALRVNAAMARGEVARVVRRRVAIRGLSIVGWGYLVSAVYALMDGHSGLDTFLRADVLHVIGLSIAIVVFLGVRPASGSGPDAPPRARKLGLAALGVGLTVSALCPWASALSTEASPRWGPLRYLAGLFVDVPGVTLMPVVPLAAWLCMGVGAAQWMIAARAKHGDTSPAGAPKRTLVAMMALGASLWAGGSFGTSATVAMLGGTLSRSHPAVLFNIVDLGGRGLLVLATGAMLANHVHGWWKRALLSFGRGSLLAYVFHIPFCYGALAGPATGRMTMIEGTGLVLLLIAASWALVLGRDALRLRMRNARASK